MRILCLILIPFYLGSFNLKNKCGKYEYKNSLLYESIELLENQTFIYKRKQEFVNYTIKGNYHVVGDSLLLDSSPQRDKIIIRELNKGKFENKTFNVTDKNGHLITFHLYVTLNDNSQKVFKDCFERLRFKSESIKSFYIINTSGIKSPEYFLEGKTTNTFEIQFETIRVFDSESWFLKDNEINPRDVNGEMGNYYLTKK